jgi:hypothetical protein
VKILEDETCRWWINEKTFTRREEGYKESIHETEKPLGEEKIVKCLEEETSWWYMNDAQCHKDTIHGTEKIFTRRKESEDFGRKKLVDNEWTVQTDTKRSFSW